MKAKSPADDPKKAKTVRTITLFLDLIILGFTIGFVYARFSEWDLFHRWQPLTAPPAAVSELLTVLPGPTGRDYTFYLRGNDEGVYACDQPEGDCWVPAELPAAEDQPVQGGEAPYLAGEISNNCKAGSSLFVFITNQPRQISDCLQFRIEFKDGFTDAALALHPDGDLWTWHNSHSGPDTLQRTLVAVFTGVGLGILAAAVWTLTRRFREQENA